MFTFHEGVNRPPEKDNNIAVFKDGEPITADQRNSLLMRLNRLGGLDNDDMLWDDTTNGSRLRVAEMLENRTEPESVTESLRKLGGEVIRSLVRELSELTPSSMKPVKHRLAEPVET
ncbi:MAG: hypothetical protein ACREA9_17545 [Pyrinomonadaceae bacterium]